MSAEACLNLLAQNAPAFNRWRDTVSLREYYIYTEYLTLSRGLDFVVDDHQDHAPQTPCIVILTGLTGGTAFVYATQHTF